ncbi:hypothetical protein V1517DRAFT_317310 [Lipomyces orientalis]|uniref:Uncharacterized protein n=1 Tax=Lipomyces orientalis TaxID=1233043 RepID=A0ACC3TTQ9_9ASCO
MANAFSRLSSMTNNAAIRRHLSSPVVTGALVVVNACLFTLQIAIIVTRTIRHLTPAQMPEIESFVTNQGQISDAALKALPDSVLKYVYLAKQGTTKSSPCCSCFAYMIKNSANQTAISALRSCLPSENIVIQSETSLLSSVSDAFLCTGALSLATYLYLTKFRNSQPGPIPTPPPAVISEPPAPAVSVAQPTIDEDQVRAIALASSAATAELSNALLKQLQAGLQSNNREIELLKGKILEVAQTAKSDCRNLQGRLNRGGDVRRELEKLKEATGRLWQCIYQLCEDLNMTTVDPAQFAAQFGSYYYPEQEAGDAVSFNSPKCILTVDGKQFDLATDNGRDEWNAYLASRNSVVSPATATAAAAAAAEGNVSVHEGTQDADMKDIQTTQQSEKQNEDSKIYSIVLSDSDVASVKSEDVKENERPILSVDTTAEPVRQTEVVQSAEPDSPTTATAASTNAIASTAATSTAASTAASTASPLVADTIAVGQVKQPVEQNSVQQEQDARVLLAQQLQDVQTRIQRSASTEAPTENSPTTVPPRAESVPATPITTDYAVSQARQQSPQQQQQQQQYRKGPPQPFQRWNNNQQNNNRGRRNNNNGTSVNNNQQYRKRYSTGNNNRYNNQGGYSAGTSPVDGPNGSNMQKLRVTWGNNIQN